MKTRLLRIAFALVFAGSAAMLSIPRASEGESITAPGARTTAVFEFQIVDRAARRIPGKLTIIGVGRTRSPRLGGRRGVPIEGGATSFNRVFTTSGAGSVRLRTGTYDVIASRGPEWTTHRQRITLIATGTATRFTLAPAIDTSGWLSTDLHVHGVESTDSMTPPEARIQQMVTDGVELVVSTDHNKVSDYQPSIARLGAHHLINSARGTEMTSGDWGHLVAFPLATDPASLQRAAVRARGRTGAESIRLVREASPSSIVIAVHPHSRTSSYFKDGGFNPRRDTARPGFSWDFDAIEVFNGYHRYNFGRVIKTNLRRWFDLLDHGHLVAGVGSSDSHALRGLGGQGGYPRTYVRVADDRPDAASVSDVVSALKAQRAIFTSGPFVTATIGNNGIGDVAPAPNGRATLRVRVQASPWVTTSELTVYVNGSVHTRRPIPPSRDPERLRVDIPLEVNGDSHVIVRVDGRGSLAPVAGEKKHRIPSLAVTNPIYLDVDGNGRYDPRKPHGHPVVR